MSCFKDNKLKRAACVAGIILMIIITALFFFLLEAPSRKRMVGFNENWRITYGGRIYRDVNLMDFRVPGRLKRGDFITLQNHLPMLMEDGSAIVLPIQLSNVSVAVNGKLVYGYGSEEYSKGEMVGSAVHLIRLPDGSQGDPITIVIEAGEDRAFTFFSGAVLEKTTTGFSDYLSYHIVIVMTSVSLIVAGLIFIILTGFIAYQKLGWLRINQTGMLCYTVGCWTLCEINAIQLFSLDYQWNTVIRYLFASLAIIPMVRIISSANEDTGKRKLLEDIIFYTDQALIFVVFFLSLAGKMHICNARYFFQIVAMISILCTFFIEWYGRGEDIKKNGRFREQFLALIFLVTEAIRSILYSGFHFHADFLQHSFVPYGTLLFVMAMTGTYIYELYLSYVKQVEEKALKKLAYTDGLTGLLNRSFCKDRMVELDNDDKDYHMISFDVDGLKEINDSKGHLIGDRLLISFARILEKCFSDVGDVIRPGGDEFLVISNDAGTQELNARLSWLEGFEKMEEKNLGFTFRSAYGMASRDEVPGRTTEEVYNLADRRMYEMKKRERKNLPLPEADS